MLIVGVGMRPDFIRADTTPTLRALADRGTFFANNHSIYITSTEVNGAALATGCYPARTGIVANVEYLPNLNLARPLATENIFTCRLGDVLRAGRYVGVPTLAEIIQRPGRRNRRSAKAIPDCRATFGRRLTRIFHHGKRNSAKSSG